MVVGFFLRWKLLAPVILREETLPLVWHRRLVGLSELSSDYDVETVDV